MLRHFYFGSTQNQKFRNGIPWGIEENEEAVREGLHH